MSHEPTPWRCQVQVDPLRMVVEGWVFRSAGEKVEVLSYLPTHDDQTPEVQNIEAVWNGGQVPGPTFRITYDLAVALADGLRESRVGAGTDARLAAAEARLEVMTEHLEDSRDFAERFLSIIERIPTGYEEEPPTLDGDEWKK